MGGLCNERAPVADPRVWGLLFLMALAAFGAGLANRFVYDDVVVIAANRWLRWDFLPRYFVSFLHDSELHFPGYRPLVMATFAATRELFGPDPLAFRFGNLLLHVAASGLVFELARLTFRRGGWPPLIVALLFLLHPVQTNVIALVWKRTDLLVALGMLGSIFFAWRWAESERGHRLDATLSLLCAGIAFLSKESALVLPAAIALTDLYLWRPRRSLRSRILVLYAPLSALALLHAWLIFHVLPETLRGIGYPATSFMPPSLVLDRVSYARTQLAGLVEYFRLMVWPAGLQVVHHLPAVLSFADPRFLTGVFLLAAFIVAAILLRRKQPVLSYGLLTFLLFLLPSSSIVPLHLTLDEDRLYLPLFGISLAFVASGNRLYERATRRKWMLASKALTALALLAPLLYIPHDLLRMRVWGDPVKLWYLNVKDEPEDVRAWLNLGNALAGRGDREEAVGVLRQAARVDPD